MDFTREPIVETIICAKEWHKLVVRNSKEAGQEEYFVDAVEIVSFGNASFFRSVEKPKNFLVPVADYEVVEVRETRLSLKNVGSAYNAKSSRDSGGPDDGPKKERRRSRKRREREGDLKKQPDRRSKTPEEGVKGGGTEDETIVSSSSSASLLPPPRTLVSEKKYAEFSFAQDKKVLPIKGEEGDSPEIAQTGNLQAKDAGDVRASDDYDLFAGLDEPKAKESGDQTEGLQLAGIDEGDKDKPKVDKATERTIEDELPDPFSYPEEE